MSMVKNCLFAILVLNLVLVNRVFSQVSYDTLYTMPVGPGVTYSRIYVYSVPWNINVLEVDLKNPFVKMETFKARDVLTGFETTSSMAKRNNRDGHYVVGAINGDFFGTVPINVQVQNGEILQRPISKSTIGFDIANNPVIGIVTFSGVLIVNGQSLPINGINETRYANSLVMYNSFMGPTTGTNQWGTEVAAHPIDDWLVNDTVRCVVDTIVSGVGNMGILKGGVVLSGHGSAATFLESKILNNDTIRIVTSLTPGPPKLKEMLGGFPRIIYNGSDYVDQGYQIEAGPSHTYERHPRTGVGFSRDSSKLYLVTVDGRQPGFSSGMTLHEFARLMLDLGCYQGINLDGGGSTTMVVREAIVNSPSEPERSVSNSLMVVSSARTDGIVRFVRMAPRRVRIFSGDSLKLIVTALDKYYNPIPFDTSLLVVSAKSGLGVVNSNYYFVAGQNLDSGYVYARYGSSVDSIFVVVKSLKFVRISPRMTTVDTIRIAKFNLRAYDTDGVEQNVNNREILWCVQDSGIGSIDSNGVFRGVSEGETSVIASYNKLSDTAVVRVEIGKGCTLLDSMETLSGWTPFFSNVDSNVSTVASSNATSSIGNASFKISYQFKYDGNPSYATFAKNFPVYGVPDTIWIDLKSDIYSHILFVSAVDAIGVQYRFFSKIKPPDSTRFISYPIPLGNQNFIYPMTLKELGVVLCGGVRRTVNSTYSGTIFIDNLRICYPNSNTTSIKRTWNQPKDFYLYQNFPNPFNPDTKITFSLIARSYVVLKVYDVLGREVSTLINEELEPGLHQRLFKKQGLPSGVYYYTLRVKGNAESRKMVLVK